MQPQTDAHYALAYSSDASSKSNASSKRDPRAKPDPCSKKDARTRSVSTSENASLLELAEQLTASGEGPSNPLIPAGYTYLLQHATHDISWLDLSRQGVGLPRQGVGLPRQGVELPIRELRNRRSPRFDLDSLYGQGPDVDRSLYLDGPRYFELALGANEAGEPDLPRRVHANGRGTANPEQPAVIADHRNEDNVVIGQLHLALMRLHNHFLSEQRTVGARTAFAEAQRLTRWHYQFVVLEDLLPRLCPDFDLVDRLRHELSSRSAPRGDTPPIPLEFAAAAFRVGHSMIRETYTLNERKGDEASGRRPPRDLRIFSATPANGLGGGRRLPVGWTVQWDLFVEYEDSSPQFSRLFDTHIARPLRELPMGNHVPITFRNIAYLDLLRGATLGLADGHSVVAQLDQKPSAEDGPLWLYFLREAEKVGGETFGPAAAKITAETLYDLMWADPGSYLHDRTGFAAGLAKSGFDFAALLALSGAPMKRGDLPPV